ncbi:MAG TPA: PEP-CTERM sorting domain-containing protein, partial [Candidatus Binatia bacterium]|nr:PEP-CTERM sorting domain-containing protein [Candidatus Binatia bacterium]
DVIQFAGQPVTLKFTTLDMPGSVVNGLDDIQFSLQPAPEPTVTTFFLFGLCAMGLACRRRRNAI